MNFSDNQPIYQQISNYFCNQILEKKWTPEDRIPSVREIAVKMEVNPNTAMRAFQLLQEKGILVNKRGIGHFIADDAYQTVLELKRKEFIENDLPVFINSMKRLGYTFDEIKKLGLP
ncbi:MAG: GntR family transcriptional regulator [Balneolaceae bacterium]|nr:GntR family transcriptional regulator [Balneolaceae bacterium]